MPGDYYFDTGFLLPCPALRVFDPSTGSGALVPSCTRSGGCAEKATLDNVSNQRKPGCRRGGV